MRYLDGIVHVVPNGEIATAINYTREWSRVNLNIPVGYGEDLDHVISVLNEVGKGMVVDVYWSSKIRSAPHVLGVDSFQDSGIEIKVLGETKPSMQWDVSRELRKRIKEAFDREGIEIPWPHVKLYFGQNHLDNSLTCSACSHQNLPGSKFCSNCGSSLKT